MRKRALVLFTLVLFVFGGILLQVYRLSGEYLAKAAQQQSSVTVTVANSRGTIYDTQLRPLVNTGTEYKASVIQSPEAVAALSQQLDAAAMAVLSEKLNSGHPVVTKMNALSFLAQGITYFRAPVRYGEPLLAPHLLGYMDGDGLQGLTGVELAFDDYLQSCSGTAKVTYAVDAMGRPLQGVQPTIENTLLRSKAGVVLTLDADIQKIAEQAARTHIKKGSIVVLHPSTGHVLAMVSAPDFQPDTVADSLRNEDSPLLNRALSNYNCGSVFKTVTAVAALEAGISTETKFDCNGSITMGGVTFHCHNRMGHGSMNMKDAFAASCNTYFIQLALQVGGKSLYQASTALGFDRSVQLANGIKTARGILPSAIELQAPAAIANLAIGQGLLMASPVHVAQMMATVVNGGELIRPTILKGYCDENGKLTTQPDIPPQSAFSAHTADTLRELMVYAVEEGTGVLARPLTGNAGGKTGTAETGWMQNGNKVVQSWFAGYYPATKPQYVIAVLAEDTDNGGGKSSPAFKQICEELYMLEQFQKTK